MRAARRCCAAPGLREGMVESLWRVSPGLVGSINRRARLPSLTDFLSKTTRFFAFVLRVCWLPSEHSELCCVRASKIRILFKVRHVIPDSFPGSGSAISSLFALVIPVPVALRTRVFWKEPHSSRTFVPAGALHQSQHLLLTWEGLHFHFDLARRTNSHPFYSRPGEGEAFQDSSQLKFRALGGTFSSSSRKWDTCCRRPLVRIHSRVAYATFTLQAKREPGHTLLC